MQMQMQMFISCVSREFGSYRSDLVDALTANDRVVKVQEQFEDGGGTLLEKLDAYIDGCDAIIHLIGDGVGATARPAEVRWLLEQYPDFPIVLPELAPDLDPDACPFTYTQWECLLAIYHRVPCYIYLADEHSDREPDWAATRASVSASQAYLQRLKALGQDRRMAAFSDAREIAIRFLSAHFSDGGQAPARPGAGVVYSWPALPRIPPYELADREPEFALFQALVTGQSEQRALLLYGPSDRGKSVLLAQFLRVAERLAGLQVGYAEFKTALPLDTVLDSLRRDLSGLRFPRFDREQRGQARSEMLRAAFLQDLQECSEPVLLLLDTFEQAGDQARRWVEDHLLPRCRQHPGLRLVITGQQVPEPVGPLAALTVRRELPLIPEPEPWCAFYREVLNGVLPDDHMRTLVRATQGSPRAMRGFLGKLLSAETQA